MDARLWFGEADPDPEVSDREAREWLTPEEEAGIFETDPWTGVIDDWAEELEEPFGYPAGLP